MDANALEWTSWSIPPMTGIASSYRNFQSLIRVYSRLLAVKQVVRHASAALALTVWKTVVLAVTPMPHESSKWPPELELHQPRRVFSALLICLSYLAIDR
jgi:hypothetical protein